ncbi:MAG: iron ABC transporter permease [Actinomycetota bacterium]|nr:iron ABC transporter permease [Actinomycetota bacterium]MEE2958309.1 iron ABC transporter permease [Actinomycetota bacterium]
MDGGRAAVRRAGRRAAAVAVWALPAAFLAVFFLYPVGTILFEGLDGRGLDRLVELGGRASFRSVAWFTLWQAVASTVLTVLVALPGAHLLARRRFRGKALLRAVTTVPFVLPTVVVGGAFLAVFERLGLDDGPLRLTRTAGAILVAHVFFNVAVVLRTVGTFWEGLDPRADEQARVLGATPWQAFRWVTWPALRPAVAAAASIVFLFCFTSFGVVLVLGGPARATLETEVWRHAVSRGDLASATAVALVQLAAVVAAVVASNHLQRRRAVVQRPVRRVPLPRAGRGLLAGNLSLLAAVLGLPVVVLVERSLRQLGGGSGGGWSGGWTLGHYAALADRVNLLPVSALEALGNSLLFAVVAGGVATVVGGLAAVVVVHGRRAVARAFDLGMMLPLGVSAVTLGFGMLLALDEPPLDLRSSRWLVPVAHSLVGVPFVMRTVVPTLRSVDQRLREAASTLGASPARVRREVDCPLALRALAVGAAFSVAVSLGEFGATSFLPRHPDRLTAPLALFRLLGVPGGALRGQAMALAVVLMVLTAAAVLVIEGGRRGSVRGDW